MSKRYCLAAIVGSLAGVLGTAGAANALPKYAQTEGKTCVYCHTAAPPTGKNNNYRGLFYKQNKYTFAGFDDAAEAKKAGVEIGPDAAPLPKSYSPPKTDDSKPAEETPKPAEETPKPAAEKPTPPMAQPRAPKGTLTVAQATLKFKAAEKAHLKAPKNAAKKKTFAAAVAQLGRATMYAPELPPMQKYPQALRLYRQALSLDPKNQMALADKKMIEGAYKSMGRPVPK